MTREVQPAKRWRRWGAVVGLVGAAGVVLAIAVSVRTTAQTPAEVARPAAVEPAPAAVPPGDVEVDVVARAANHDRGAPVAVAELAVEDVLRAQAEPTVAALDVLLAGLESTDAIVVAEASNGLVARGALSALPVLVAFDVIGRPWAAPSVIDALGRLAAQAEADERGEAIARLVALMHEEKRRGALESQGNLLQIYEALGQTGDSRAVAPLEGELLDPAVQTAPKVVVVQALVALRAQASRAPLERLRDQLQRSAPGHGLEAELRRDLLSAIELALVQLS
jgi:hypothetical protein